MGTSDLSYPGTRQAVVEAAQALFTNGVMSHSGHANLSARVDDQKMVLTVEGQVRGARRWAPRVAGAGARRRSRIACWS